jgi:hypothetical protein
MGIFASYFWLWSIVGLVALILLYSFGALMNFAGFLTRLKAASQWVDRATPRARLLLIAAFIAVVAYPSFVHKLWADATADGMRNDFQTLAAFPGALGPERVEHLSGLYDAGGAQGTYILGWFGTGQSGPQVADYFRQQLRQRGWVEASPADRETARFVDGRAGASPHYDLVVAVASKRDSSVPAALAAQPTVFAVRLGVVDPRVTTQVSWFIDCLVRWAPTLPSCEAGPWHPLDAVLKASPGSFRFP